MHLIYNFLIILLLLLLLVVIMFNINDGIIMVEMTFNIFVCITKGVNSFHICLDNDPDHVKWRDEEVYQILKRCKELKALLMVHAENGTFIEEVREEDSSFVFVW